MTTIHATKQKTWTFPTRHHSLVSPVYGWIVDPAVSLPNLKISDDKDNVVIDVHIPGITKDQIEINGHEPWVMSSTKVSPTSDEEIIHITLPKTKEGEKK